jgi:Arc/MetJ family transcription regulator
MSDWLFGLAFLWAAFAPLLLVVLVIIAARLLKRRSARPWPLAAVLVLVPVALLYGWDRWQFARLCDGLGAPQVLERQVVDGVLLDSPTANSFGMRYLHDGVFSWIEIRDIYRRDGWRRYTRYADGRITDAPIDAPTAAILVRETHEHRGGVSIARTEVRERASDRLLAQAAQAHSDGGPAKWVLGAWGTATCPSAGSSDWSRWYHLARETLRP